MNHVYRVVFNKALGVYQCVSELAKSNGKSSNRSTISQRSGIVLSALSVAMLGMSAVSAQATTYNASTIINNDPYEITDGDIITGTDTVVETKDVVVATTGTGSLVIQNGGQLQNTNGTSGSNDVIVGRDAGSSGEVTVTGNGSKLVSKEKLVIGSAGTGSVTVKDQGAIEAGFTIVGKEVGNEESLGTLTVKGDGSKLDTFELVVGTTGRGSVIVEEKGTITAKLTVIGSESGSVGTLTVKGEESKLDTSDSLYIGDIGTGTVTVENGGTLKAGNTYVGYASDSEGTLTIKGVNSEFNTNSLYIGENGKGNIIINEGGYAEADNIYIGNDDNGAISYPNKGTITVTGKNTVLEVNGNINLKQGDNHTISIKDNANIIAKNIKFDTSYESNPTSATVNFDNGILVLNASTLDLFAGFDADDTINLADASDTSIGGGTIDIRNDATVTIASGAVITGGGDFTKTGIGRLAMDISSKKWKGATNINQGILEIDGKYIMGKNEVLIIGLNSETDYGQLFLTAGGNIKEGLLRVNASNMVLGLKGDPVWKNVVSGASIEGEFANTDDIDDNSPLVSFVAIYKTDSVDLKMISQGDNGAFVPAVESQGYLNDLGIAHVLDRAIDNQVDSGDNPLAEALIVGTIDFDNVQLATTANQLQPLLMGATNRIITDSNYLASEAINSHSSISPKRSLWAKAIGNKGSHDLENGVTGYDADSYGAVAGLDIPMNKDLNLGVAVSYMDNDIDSNGRLNHQADVKSWQVLGYGRYAANDNTFVNFHAGAGRSDVEGERRIPILTDAIALSDYDVDTLQAGVGIHHRIGSAERNLSPFTQFSYAQAKSDSYRESGAGVYNLNVADNRYESLRWTAGLNLSQALTDKLAITGQLAGAIENGDQHSDITASFVGSNDRFKTIGQDIGQEIGIAGIGISYVPTARTTLSAGYRGEWRENYDDQGANVAVQMTF